MNGVKMLDRELKRKILIAQRNEITECAVYRELASVVKNDAHAEVLRKIAQEERGHYEYFKTLTQQDVTPDQGKVFLYVLISKTLGLNFGLKLMERGEHLAQEVYDKIKESVLRMPDIMRDEKKHERELLDLIDEDRLKYVSSVILGLNDALIELTAALAGFTIALQQTKLIGMLGLITGIAAAMSMAASEYLATKHEGATKDPVKACIYTGISYIGAVLLLVTPYFIFTNIFLCLASAIGVALSLIVIFTYYTSVAQGTKFKERFMEMAFMSLGIAGVTFLIGLAARKIFGVNV